MLLSKYTALLLLPFFSPPTLRIAPRPARINWRSGTKPLAGIAPLAGAPRHGFPPGLGRIRIPDWRICTAIGPVAHPAGAPYFQGAVFQYLQSRLPHSFFPDGHAFQHGLVVLFSGRFASSKFPVAILILLAGLVLARRKLGMIWRPDELYLVMPLS